MKVTGISLQHYRNIELARLQFDPARPTFFVGANGQGKSNLLEALGMVTAIRSFRTHELAPLIQRKRRSASLFYQLLDEQEQESEVEISISARKRSIKLDGTGVSRMVDYVGLFPSVVFSADDTQLIKSGPQVRRRFFDLLLSVVDSDYLISLQSYHRALKERNNALKVKMNRSVVMAYDRVIARHGLMIISRRNDWSANFTPLFEENYRKIVAGEETGEIIYLPSIEVDTEEAFVEKLESTYERDSVLGSTTSGPHRDDFQFKVSGMGAKTHGSEGQQRSVVLALKLAQIEFIKRIVRRKPIVLLDDILGELDEDRKERFWQVFNHQCQVFASGTSIPRVELNRKWNVYSVENGGFSQLT